MTITNRTIAKAIANRTATLVTMATTRAAAFIDAILDRIDDYDNDIAWCEDQIAYVDSEFTHGRLDWNVYDEYVTRYENDIQANAILRNALAKSVAAYMA